jgi:predicted permease
VRDLRDAIRHLTRAPALSLATVATLALSLGATATVYGVVHRVLLDPLPFPDPARLVWLDHSGPGIGAERGLVLTQGLYAHYRAFSRSLSQLTVYTSVDRNVVADGDAERLAVTLTTASFAATFGRRPTLGRFFSGEEDRPGAPPVVVLSDGFWQRRFGRSAAAVGRRLAIDGVAHEIIGVMPSGFDYPSTETSLWVPIALDPASTDFGSFSLEGVGRLSAGATVASAQRDLEALLPRVAEAYPGAAAMLQEVKLHALVSPLRDHVVGDVERTLWILLAAVGFVLAVAAANLTGLFIVRSESRQRELAVRVALGAGRRTLFRQQFAESLLLTVAGGAVGLTLAWWLLRLLRAHGPADLPRREAIGMDPSVGIVTAIVVAALALLFTIPPLMHKPRVARVLRESGRGITSSRQRIVGRHALVAGQVSLAMMLMIGAGLMLRSFWHARHLNPGFVAEAVLTFEVGLSRAAYDTPEKAILAQQAILARVQALPSVENAGATPASPSAGAGRVTAGTQRAVLPLPDNQGR